MSIFRTCLTFVMAVAMTSCAGANASMQPLASAAPGPYQLGPGDQIRINVFGLDALNNTYLVGDTGEISLPMIGTVTASGKTITRFETDVADSIRAKQLVLEPKVSAQILAYRPFFILGEVQRPGQYPYVPGMSVMTAVSVAGGYTFRANTKKVMVTRSSAKGSAGPDSSVQPGDLIQVQESWF
ncbi:polysaccharide export protein [Sphingobium sp. SCG-1]|uniref:polysaccharide biosynthesis/export family protein n=1 Tax=Sphingobium sp. SCG-1 TaxID=2072936 RepID=UPI000CD6AD80|nr:polysaccharide biosynthesis/export family protein [Sphingobium sp. SCG-1]AUW57373.1 polysaccharide export protein [Sphingobium sp. SCG-1]